MTGLTGADRDLMSRALYVAGCDRYSAEALASAHECLTEMVRLAERLGGRIEHLARQLAASRRPAGLTAVERDHVRSLRQQIERMQFRLELSLDEPVRYALTPAAEALFPGGASLTPSPTWVTPGVMTR